MNWKETVELITALVLIWKIGSQIVELRALIRDIKGDGTAKKPGIFTRLTFLENVYSALAKDLLEQKRLAGQTDSTGLWEAKQAAQRKAITGEHAVHVPRPSPPESMKRDLHGTPIIEDTMPPPRRDEGDEDNE